MPGVDKRTRPIGVAVGELFKKALVTHQGVCYEVTSIDNGGENLYPLEASYKRMRRKLQLFNPDFDAFLPPYPKWVPGTDPVKFAQELAKKIKIVVPKRITCKITRELAQFRCMNNSCGWFGPVTFVKEGRRCPECGSLVLQAPVYRWDEHKDNNGDPPSAFIQPIVNPPCKKHGAKKVFHRLIPQNYKTPISSLRLICPECKDKGRAVVRRKYKLGLPSSSLRRKIMTSQVHLPDEVGDWQTLDHFGLLSDEYVSGVYWVDNMTVYQVTFGYSYETGHCWPLDDAFMGREFPTQGLVIQFKPDVYPKLLKHIEAAYESDPELYQEFVDDLERVGREHYDEDDEDILGQFNEEQLKRWVLHTLKHAFLMMIPLKTGLDHTKFAGSYDLDDDRVIIYDNEFGGIGGTRLLALDDQLFMDYLELTRKRVRDCDCRTRCLKCLVANYCGEVNNALNRHLIGPVFNVETDYE